MAIDDGGPAFPFQPLNAHGMPMLEAQPGMSLRDHFAGLAMQKLIDCEQSRQLEISLRVHFECNLAYAYADAMLAARKG